MVLAGAKIYNYGVNINHEFLLWGLANDIPIGLYKRGGSLTQVLKNL